MKKDSFNRLMESANQALEHAQGKRNDLRTTTLPKPLPKMKGSEVAELRQRLKCSQGVFARYINVSVKTVQGWEQELSKPSGAALKLLTIAKKNPQILFNE
jgi:putative transcriptional regulator